MSRGFSAERFVDHSITMHVGAPRLVRSRCDGLDKHRLQVPGDIEIVPAGFWRAWESERAIIKLTIDVSPAFVETTAENMGLNVDLVSIAPQLHVNDAQIAHIGWALKTELETEEPLGRLYADGLGLALAAHLLRRYAGVVPTRAFRDVPKHRLQRATDYIHDNLSRDLTLTELATIANMSPSHFKVLFKQLLGMPVHQYVIRRRVEYAVDLLSRGSLPLSEIARRSGFADQSHMARWVRRVTGVTPRGVMRDKAS